MRGGEPHWPDRAHLCEIGDHVGGEHVDGLVVPQDPRHPHTFPHEDFAVKSPKVSAMGERNEFGLKVDNILTLTT